MKSTVEPLEGNKVKLSVEVDESEFDKAIDAAFKRIAREVRIPGFRPGKAPRKVLEARLGAEAARAEALQHALPEFYAEAVSEHDVDVIAAPEIEITGGRGGGRGRLRRRRRGPARSRASPATAACGSSRPARGHRRGDRRPGRPPPRAVRRARRGRPAAPPTATSSPSTSPARRTASPSPGLTAEDYLYRVGAAPIVARARRAARRGQGRRHPRLRRRATPAPSRTPSTSGCS